jgi:hypothetical protein
MKKLLLAGLVSLTAAPTVIADTYLIEEMESLKSSLDKTDPDRIELSLRLADLYFEVSIQEASDKDASIMLEYRKKAHKLYEDVLYGRDGLPKITGKKEIKVKYQLARVLGKLSEIKKARNYYQDVFESKLASKQLKRESAFALAEFSEELAEFKLADKYYVKAIGLCESVDSCNYAHYKRAWLLYREVRLDEAIVELKLSLWDSKGNARDKVINDLLLFFSNRRTDGTKELAYIKDLISKNGQKDLVRKLIESFYSAGNRVAGSTVLEFLNEEKSDVFYEIRLLEEFYGFSNWEKVDTYLSKIESRSASELPKTKEESKESKAMIKRVIVQFDSEAQQDPAYYSFLKRSIDVYLSFYPNDDMRKKMQQGWLKAEENKSTKVDRLGLWIKEDTIFGFKKDDIRKLRQTRLALAQDEKKSEIVIEEALAIAKILKGSVEEREFNYVAARELYKNKKYELATPLFVQLASLSVDTEIDKWGLQSQNLLLDIYNTKKDFNAIIFQSNLWLSHKSAQASKLASKDLLEMKTIHTQASFEQNASLGETKEALDGFYKYCFDKVYEDKSCSNAKILSVKLKDQVKLIALLEKAKDEKALMSEYELMGRFSDAAKLQEKFILTKKSGVTEYLKISLLFELSQDFKNRDRILNKLISKIKRDKKIDPKYEGIIYLNLKEAGFFANSKILNLPWSLKNKLALANMFDQESSTKKTRKIITSQENFSGPMWSKYALDKVQRSYKKQSRISFYGRRSEKLFKRRTKSLERFSKVANSYLEGSDSKTRIYILNMLKTAYQNLAIEIMSTPLPDGLTDDIMMQVQANLASMSNPYSTVAADYTRLQEAEIKTMLAADQEKMRDQLEEDIVSYSNLIEKTEMKIELVSSIDFTGFDRFSDELSINPESVTALTKMESFYTTNKNKRIAAYFTGRINSLKE